MVMTDERKAVDDRIREIYTENGKITPDMVIDDARDPDSPLHDQFNWNMEEAAMATWRDTARRLIRSVRVTITTEDIIFHGKPGREFISDPGKERGEQGYTTKAELRTDRDRALSVIANEIDRVESAIRRCRTVAEELGLSNEINLVQSAVVGLKKKAQGAA